MEIKKTTTIYKILTWSLLVCATLLIIDEFNLPSQLLFLPKWIWIIVTATIGCFIFFVIDKGVLNLLRTKSINVVDHIFMITTISFPICLIYLYFSANQVDAKIYIYSYAFVISLIALSLRGLIICTRNDKKVKKNIIDLQELYENKMVINPALSILVEDNDKINYDLLNHNHIVQGLYQAIIHCYTEESFTFGLEGPWGSGKTTIINKVKKLLHDDKKNQIVVIDDFDPWLFGNQESLLISLYDMILTKMNIKVGTYKSQKYIKHLTSTIANTNNTGKIIDSVFLSHQNEDENIVNIRNNLVRILKAKDSRYVIFIDNLDRADPDNVLFVLKLIATYFDLPNIIFVLSYDKDRVCSILKSHNIDSSYLEKITQTVYRVPLFIQSQRERIVRRCLKNLLSGIGDSEIEISDYDTIINYIIKKVDSIRSFKRYINSVYNIVFVYNHHLSKEDLLAIETINFFDNELYSYIYFHREFFITFDRILDSELWIHEIRKEESNKKAKEELGRLFDIHPESMDILASLFPTIRRYKSSMDIFDRYNQYSNDEYRKTRRKMAISNARYFDLYFHNRMNEYAISEIDVKETINRINIAESHMVDNIIGRKIKEIPDIYQRDWFEQFEIEIDSITPEKQKAIVISLVQNWHLIADIDDFMTLSARDRVAVIIHKIIEAYNLMDFSELTDILEKRLDRFLFVNYLILLYRDENTNEIQKQQKQLLEECAQRMCNNVVNLDINLLSDDYYLRGNTFAFAYRYEKSSLEIDNLEKYINTIVTPHTVYRFLLEMLSIRKRNRSDHRDTIYVYDIDTEAEKLFSVHPEMVIQFIENNPPDNKGKMFLANLYTKHVNKSSTTENLEENGVEIEEEMIFDDI